MCEQGRNADAVKMVHALARLFRISISKGHELIPIAKEIEHAESYLQIQKYRYKNQFTYRLTWTRIAWTTTATRSPSSPSLKTPSTTAWICWWTRGVILVRVRQDRGHRLLRPGQRCGHEPEQIDAIMQHGPKDRTGIGIKNVNDRLKIYFGKAIRTAHHQ